MPDQLNDGGVGPGGSGYEDMARYQMISQYQQNLTNPESKFSYYQAQRVQSGARFQYGLGENQPDVRFYRRQAELSRSAFGASVSGAVANQLSYEAAAMGVGVAAAAGVATGGAVGAFLLPMAIAAAPMYFINKGINNNLMRQRTMQTMAADIEQYRSNLGMPNLSYGSATQLGQNLMGNAFNNGQFFNPQQQMDVLKTALANDMLTSKTKGSGVGDMRTFEKNFKELLSTTEMVVKTLKTTKEGGLAVIKEMQQQGFGTMGQVQAGIASAQAYGKMTGLGTQNLLQIGAAGAAAVQGTPWSAPVGAAMYQTGAAMAGAMARNGPAMNQTVQMAGGVAQAGATLARVQMATLQSGLGSKVVAYAMDSKGNIDNGRLTRLMSGQVSGYEINMGAAGTGYQMMMSGDKVLFQRKKAELLNRIAETNPEYISRMFQSGFTGWASSRRGNTEQQAQAFGTVAANYIGMKGDIRTESLIADMLKSAKPYGAMAIETQAANAASNQLAPPESKLRQNLRKAEWKYMGGLIEWGGDFSSSVTGSIGAIQTGYQSATRGLKSSSMNAAEQVLSGIAPGGIWRRGNVGNVAEGYRNLYGLGLQVDQKYMDQYASMTRAQQKALTTINSVDVKQAYGVDVQNVLGKASSQDLTYLMQTLRTGLGNERSQAIFSDPNVLSTMGITKFSPRWKDIMSNPSAAAANLLTSFGQAGQTATKKASDNMSEWDKYSQVNSKRSSDLTKAQSFAGWLSNDEKQKFDAISKKYDEKGDVAIKNLSQSDRDILMARRANVGAQNISKYSDVDWTSTELTKLEQTRKSASERIRKELGVDYATLKSENYKKEVARTGVPLTDVEGTANYEYKKQRNVAASVKASVQIFQRNRQLAHDLGLHGSPEEQLQGMIKAYGAADYDTLLKYQEKGYLPKGKDVKAIALKEQERLSALADQTIGQVKLLEAAKVGKSIVSIGKLTNKKAVEYFESGGGNAALLDESAISDIAKQYGMRSRDVKFAARSKDPATNLINTLNNINSGSHESDSDSAKQARIVKQISDLNNDTKSHFLGVSYVDASGKEHSFVKKEDAIRNLQLDLGKLSQNGIQMSDRDVATGRSIDTMVHAPVLNYWANRWVM